MDFMGVNKEMARQIVGDELSIYRATRFRLTTRLRIFNRVDADPQQREGLEKELMKLEEVIAAYEGELAQLA